MAKRKKGKKGKRRGYSKKRRGHAKKASLGVLIGSLLAANELILEATPRTASMYTAVKAQAGTANKVNAAVSVTKNMDWIAVGTPLAAGIVVSMIGGKLGVNKYVRKIPVIGKKVTL